MTTGQILALLAFAFILNNAVMFGVQWYMQKQRHIELRQKLDDIIGLRTDDVAKGLEEK